MKAAFAALLAACALLAGGCSLGDEDEPAGGSAKAPRQGPGDLPRAGEPGEARAIRGWAAALNAGDYAKAAGYFAPDAIVKQAAAVRLEGREDAIAFNRSLPCKAEVTDVDDEGETVLAAFRLRPGPGGGETCGGPARVRFRFEDGKFAEWRQLSAPAAPEGEII